MDEANLIRPSVLKSLKKNKHLKLKQLLGDGKFTQGILLDVYPNQEAIGKIVSVQNEGEFTLWPKLQHESLIPLLEIVAIDESMWLFVSPYLKISLGLQVAEVSFIQHPKCFDRKKSYVRDVFSGLEYLHQQSLSLMNLSDQNILICSRSDRALISDFSLCVSVKMATKLELQVDNIKFLPPELKRLENGDAFECMPVDMWLCGIMVFQIFTGHVLQTIEDSENILSGLTMEILLKANAGSYLVEDSATCLSEFLEPFLRQDPGKRIDVKAATGLPFLRTSARRLDEQARQFWKMKDEFELLSNANKFQVLQQKFGQKSNVHTMCYGNNFDCEGKVKALKTICLNNAICRKAKSELFLEKSVQRVEGKLQPHNSITFINCLYENSNDAVPENSFEPQLVNDFITLPHTDSSINVDTFPCDYLEVLSTNKKAEFNSSQEKDPWGENEQLRTPSKTKLSKSWSKIETSFPNSTTSNVPQGKYFELISNFPSNSFRDNPQDGTQETSPIKEQLAANQTCEQFHQAMLTENDHPDTNENLHEPRASNPKIDKLQKEGFSNVSWRHEKKCAKNISMAHNFTRRNACRFKKGTRLRKQFGCRSVSQRAPELAISPPNLRDISSKNCTQEISPSSPIKKELENHVCEQFHQAMLADNDHRNMNRSIPQYVPKLIPAANLRDIFVHDHMDQTAFAFLLDGMYCYNLRRPADTRKKLEKEDKAKRDNLLPGRTNSENYQVDISPDLYLCSNIESMKRINDVKETVPKNKPGYRFLRMLCPGSTPKIKFNK